MKKFLSLILVLMLAVTGVMFAGCGETNSVKLEGGPSLEEDVYGNGSFVVRKGDYVYYASGFVSKDDLGSAGISNTLGSVTNGAIYRAKISSKEIEITDSNAEGGKRTENTLVLSTPELLVSKVAGYENSGLYVFGNKLFFATPSTAKNTSGTTLYSNVVFYSVDLDGQNLTEIYTAKDFNNGSFSFVSIDNVVYLIFFDGKDITKVDLNGNATKLVSDVKTVALPTTKNIENNEYQTPNYERFVYFTAKNEKTTDIKDFGTILKKVNIVSGEIVTLLEKDYITVNIVKLEDSKLYFTRNEIVSGSKVTADSYLYIANLANENFAEEKFSYQSTISSAIRVDLENKHGYVYVNNSKLIFKDDEGDVKSLTSSISSLLFVKDNFVYYISSSALYRVDLTADSPSAVKLSDSSSIDKAIVDETNGMIFFFVKNSNVYETYYVDVNNFISGTTKPVKAK